MVSPKKLAFVRKFREIIDAPIIKLPLPNVNPNILSALSVLMAILFVIMFKYNRQTAFLFIVLSLIFDWFDGIIARKYKKDSEEGYMIDTTCDRLSEGIIFSIFFTPWFYLFAINNLLTLYGFKIKLNLAMPLKLMFIIYYLIFLI